MSTHARSSISYPAGIFVEFILIQDGGSLFNWFYLEFTPENGNTLSKNVYVELNFIPNVESWFVFNFQST